MNGHLKSLVAVLISFGGAGLTWIEQANSYGKFAATIIAIIAGLFALWDRIERRVKRKNEVKR